LICIIFSSKAARPAQRLPKSLLQLPHSAPTVIRAHGGIALDHPKRPPAAFLLDRFEVNPGHHAMAGPVMTPVMR
jgi:hypothetical protein